MILAIDQSTSGTKALLFDDAGALTARHDLPHEQITPRSDWVEHDPEEIFANVLALLPLLRAKHAFDSATIHAVGITNQRETVLAWDRLTGKPLYNAIVWQDARAADLCAELAPEAERIRAITGLPLSPYFSAAKLAWLHRHVPAVAEAARENRLCCGTIDAWLLFKLTGAFKTDYSNASRTQLLSLKELAWSEDICALFGIAPAALPAVCSSDSDFGASDFGGFFAEAVPIRAMLGDSHASLFGQGCHQKGQAKTTYGTGSSIMMNTGDECISSRAGLATSLAWGRQGRAQYVLEGNINYSAAVVNWLVYQLQIIKSPAEVEALAKAADPADTTYLVPAFSGLGAPYWDSHAQAALIGMGRKTGRAEIARAALESIALQIAEVVLAMERDSGQVQGLRADGGASKNALLMQMQADILGQEILVSEMGELSSAGVAYMAGIACGLYVEEALFAASPHTVYRPAMSAERREKRLAGWRSAVAKVLTHE